jgi:hypothetical protein
MLGARIRVAARCSRARRVSNQFRIRAETKAFGPIDSMCGSFRAASPVPVLRRQDGSKKEGAAWLVLAKPPILRAPTTFLIAAHNAIAATGARKIRRSGAYRHQCHCLAAYFPTNSLPPNCRSKEPSICSAASPRNSPITVPETSDEPIPPSNAPPNVRVVVSYSSEKDA